MTVQACLNDASSLVRHEWLEAAIRLLRPRFGAAGYTVPDNVRVSIGFPKYTAYRHCIGQCWSDSTSSDRRFEIFVSPELGDAEQTSRIIGVAAHELVHATVGTAAGHRKPFKLCALAIGLTGPMTATSESEEFVEWVQRRRGATDRFLSRGPDYLAAQKANHAPGQMRMHDVSVSRANHADLDRQSRRSTLSVAWCDGGMRVT
jgi:hypothetical protein